MAGSEWRNWGSHPLVVIITVIASVLSIYSYLSAGARNAGTVPMASQSAVGTRESSPQPVEQDASTVPLLALGQPAAGSGQSLPRVDGKATTATPPSTPRVNPGDRSDSSERRSGGSGGGLAAPRASSPVAQQLTVDPGPRGPNLGSLPTVGAPTVGSGGPSFDVEVSTGFNGSWSGLVEQVRPPMRYPVELEISSNAVGSVAGMIDYPTLGCGGQLILRRVQGTKWELREMLTYGAAKCVDGGLTLLEWMDASEVRWSWSDQRGSTEASAVLKAK